MHRSYRVNQPTQIIRYGNRIEIINPGFSLKPEDHLGEPGSEQRNPFIAAIFHETNLAETKGSGIRTMRKLMDQAGMVPPTYESNHSSNQFTARLLLHHFLSEEDLRWLQQFKQFDLSENQKKALIFVREVGAIDNATFRQLGGLDGNKASAELRALRDNKLLELKGKGRATYYISGNTLPARLNTPVSGLNTLPQDSIAPVGNASINELPEKLAREIKDLGRRTHTKEAINRLIIHLCQWKPLNSKELAAILNRDEKHLLRNYITPLRKAGRLQYTEPAMPNHPEQAYRAD